MESNITLAVGLGVILLLWALIKYVSIRARSFGPKSPAQKELDRHLPRLRAEWREMEKNRELHGPKHYFFRPITDSQIEHIKSLRLTIDVSKLNRGMAYDIINLLDPDEDRSDLPD